MLCSLLYYTLSITHEENLIYNVIVSILHNDYSNKNIY